MTHWQTVQLALVSIGFVCVCWAYYEDHRS